MNGVDFGDSLDSNGRDGLVFGSCNTVLSSAGARLGTDMALVGGEWERFRSLEVSDSKPFSCDVFGSSDFSFDLQFSSVGSVSTYAQTVLESIKPTVSGTAAATVGIGSVTTICHRNLVLLIDMAAPHALRVHSGIGTTTEGTPQAGFLTLWPGFAPTFLKVLFLSRTPTSGGFKLSRIWNGVWIGIPRRDEILWVQKPVFVVRQDVVCETLGKLLGIRKICERRVEEYGTWVRGCGVHGVHDMG